MKRIRIDILLMTLALGGLMACGGGGTETNQVEPPQSMVEKAEVDPMDNPGVGPVAELILPDEIDTEMAAKGDEIYKLKCTACHKPDEKFIGPAPKGIMERRNPAWIMNMILNPDQMVKEDPIAKKLLMESASARVEPSSSKSSSRFVSVAMNS